MSVLRLVLEFCPQGALLGVFQKKQADFDEASLLLLEALVTNFAVGIAGGMAYLAGRRFVHRDLALRNVLIDADDVPKIAE